MRAFSVASCVMASAMLLTFGTTVWAADPPTEQLGIAKAAVAAAQSDGAAEGAPVELKSAQDKLSEATMLAEKNKRKDYPKVQTLAEEAAADAQLADAKTAAGKAEKSLQQVQEGNRTLQEEMMRPNSGNGGGN